MNCWFYSFVLPTLKIQLKWHHVMSQYARNLNRSVDFIFADLSGTQTYLQDHFEFSFGD